jgi:hypothetical protein
MTMSAVPNPVQDVMQVCRNGHVITIVLRSNPDSGLPCCDRCGAGTLSQCPTCGRELPGAGAVHGMQPIGAQRPPQFCAACGAAFPWTDRPPPPATSALGVLENLLRRLPLVIRQLRDRHGDRPPFRITDERDLEDLLRTLLPLSFDVVRRQCRTPRYDTGTRTDFLLVREGIALTVKWAQANLSTAQLVGQFQEDAAYYRKQENCATLVGFICDPEGVLGEPRLVETACSSVDEALDVRCVVA